MSKQVYVYSPTTFEYLHEILVDESPLDAQLRAERNEAARKLAKETWVGEGEPDPKTYEEQASVFLVPAFSTDIEPPLFNAGERPIFDPNTNTWSVVPDHRSLRFFDIYTGEEKEGLKLGEILENKSDAVLVTPPELDEGYIASYENGEWVAKEDLRGKEAYIIATKEPVLVTYLEKGRLPEELTLKIPFPASKWDEATKSWVTDEEALTKLNNWEIGNQLETIDKSKIRALTDFVIGKEDVKSFAVERLRTLEEQSVVLRSKLK